MRSTLLLLLLGPLHGFTPALRTRRQFVPRHAADAADAADDADAAAPGASVLIRYCAGCNWMNRATWVAQELLTTFNDDSVLQVTLQPQRQPPGGEFTIDVDGRRVWDRRVDGFPEPKQFKRRVRDAIEPQRELGHNDRAAARAADAAAEAAASAPAPSADWEAEEEISRRDARKQAFDIGQPAADASAPKWGDWTRQSGDVDAELAKLMALGRDAAVRKLEGEVDSDS